MLREFLLNEDSENASVYAESERKELIFQIFRIFVVGGSLCQPDPTIERCVISTQPLPFSSTLQLLIIYSRYLDITKSFYKELVTVYRLSILKILIVTN